MNDYDVERDDAWDGLPEGLRHGMRLYIEDRVVPGSFLKAVLCNNLSEACAHADSENRYRLFDIVLWIYNEAPGPCWGSEQKVDAWLRGRG